LICFSAAEASAGLVQTSGKRTASGWQSSVTLNAASAFTVGNTVIVSMASYASSADLASVTIADTVATRAVRAPASWDGTQVASIIYFAKIVNPGRTDVVLTNNQGSSTNYVSLSIDEWSGLQDNPLDQTATGGATSTSPAASSGTLTQVGEVVYFAHGYYLSTQMSITDPAGYTAVYEELDGINNSGGGAYYKVVFSTAPEAPFAVLATGDTWSAAIATFKLALTAPTIGLATPGFGSATVAFTAPAIDGGSPITGYTATCGSQSNTGATSPITVSGLPNGVPTTCTVFATNADGNGPPSAPSNSVTPNGPVVNISGVPAAAPEGCALLTCSGFTNFVFTLTRTGPAIAFSAQYVIGGDVVAPEDYTAHSGTIAFTAAQASRTVTVAIKRDSKYETNEALTLTLVGANNGASVGTTTFAATTVQNDDSLPRISIGNRTATEGTVASFAVTLSNASYLPISVTAMTAAGTAAGVAAAPFWVADYTPTPPLGTTVNFPPGVTVVNFPVATVNDTVYEGGALGTKETFFVNLSNGLHNGVPGLTITDAQGDGFITDNETVPTVSISSAANVAESAGTYPFTVTLNRPSVATINVTATANDGTAQQLPGAFAISDFAPLTQTLTFVPGETSKTVNVTVNEDTLDEANETFSVQLGTPVNVSLGTSSRTGTINDNDDSPALSIVATSSPVAESAGTATFTVSLSGVSGRPVSVTVQTVASPGTATAVDDYTPAGPTLLTWAAGDNTPQTFVVTIVGDALSEASETFRATLTGAANATTSPSYATMTITDAAGVIPAGALVISEFRLSGPGGAEDEFIEIANTTSAPITVSAPDSSGGFSVATTGGVPVFTIPNGTIIPARGHLLAANNTMTTGYSLQNYGGVNAATPDAVWAADIPDNTGLALFPTDNAGAYGATAPLDAVGFTSDPAPYLEGTGLTGIGVGPFANNYSLVRRYATGPGAALQDTGDNAADFALVAVDAGTYGPVTALLGAPSPENLAAEREFSNSEITMSGAGAVSTGSAGLDPRGLEFRRTFTNHTPGTLTALRFKVTSITTLNSPGGVTDLRPTDSPTAGSFQGLGLEGMPSAGYTLTTPAAGGYGAGLLPNGGLNSTWRVPAVSVGPGSTVDVNFRVEHTTTGLPYLLWVVPDGK
jgi:hypothetical protein